MYYPYLRGLQFELISIRELAKNSNLVDFVCPIIEPVKESMGSLELLRDNIIDTNWKPYLIINPEVGELSGKIDPILRFYIEPVTKSVFKPAFILNEQKDNILDIINKYNLNDVMIICLDQSKYSLDIIKLDSVTKIVLLNPRINRRLDQEIKSIDNKRYIILNDLFKPETNNSDYLGKEPEKLSEEHLFFKKDGYSGYSDYTILPQRFNSGGWAPRAVVIHWSYINNKEYDEIWIRHFTSDTNQTTSNVQGKFAEAAKKLFEANKSNELFQNDALKEILDYYNCNKYPGLGVIKKLSIKNHILINYEYLSRINTMPC